MICIEVDSKGVKKELKYWPSHTSGAIYPQKDHATLLLDGVKPLPSATQWPASGAHETHWADPVMSPYRIPKIKRELFNTEDDWKATKQWKEAQRGQPSHPLPLEDGAEGE